MPTLAIVLNYVRPDRLYLHERLVREIADLSLHTFYLRAMWEFNWRAKDIPSVNASSLAAEGEAAGRKLGSPLKDWGKGGRIIRHCREHGVQAIILEGYANFANIRVLMWCRRNGIPAFIRADSNILGDRKRSAFGRWLKKTLVSKFVQSCAGVMPMGELGRDYFVKYGGNAEKCWYVPCEPDVEIFSTEPADLVRSMREKHGIDEGRQAFIYSGRLAREKRVDLLVDAFVRLADDNPEWDLLLAGSGVLEDDLRRRVPERLADRVEWLGFLEPDEMSAAYHLSDVMVLPSEHEAWAVVVIEAMDAGCVVIASDIVQAAHELFRYGKAGCLFESGNVDSLERAMRETIEESRLEAYRTRLRPTLAGWRAACDPVLGVRRALAAVGVLPDDSIPADGTG